jgi:hypothetical protein
MNEGKRSREIQENPELCDHLSRMENSPVDVPLDGPDQECKVDDPDKTLQYNR